MKKRYLLAPGPTPVPPEVLSAMSEPIIHHRSPEFAAIMKEVLDGLKWLYQTEKTVMILTSSGTGGMDAAVSNFLSPGDKAICVRGGKFGERWAEICEAYGVTPVNIDVPWGASVQPETIAEALQQDPTIKAVYVQASETCSASVHPIRQIGEIVKKHDNTLLVVDAITALGVMDLPVDRWGIDVCVTGSQKALMLPPGAAFISVSDKAWGFNETSRCPRFYFNLKKEKAKADAGQTNFTSPVSMIIGLQKVLAMMREEGLENIFNRHARLAEATRAALQALGLRLLATGTPSNAVTGAYLPEGIDGGAFNKKLREEYGVTLAGGQAQLKGKIFRVAHLGYADTLDVITAIAAIERGLLAFGYNLELGAGVRTAEKMLFGQEQ
jgi:aspartate aminotransferase-like enzyme